jgi:VIT1/CCC1 family predicted Fe2+/Mn2+ transporter
MQLSAAETRDPLVQSLWMFVADLFAAAVPVVPFAFLALGSARVASVVITGLLLVFLGAGRAKVAGTGRWSTILETVGIATAAAVAGLLIGKWVSH